MKLFKKKDVDMTSGVIWKQIIIFALPLMLGNIFQLLYNTVDSIVVGRFVGKEALAAVGSVGSIINALVGFFSGLATGAGVVISQYYGAKDDRNLDTAVHTSIVMTILTSIIFTFLGVVLVVPMLHLMGTPDDVMEEAATYLRIYFAGLSGLMFYNIGSGLLRAVGDSNRPLFFLIFSAIVNTLLDLVFVVWFKMGVAGVAWATIIAQFLSAIMVMWILAKEPSTYQLHLNKLKMDWPMLKKIVNVGLPAAIQMSLVGFANIFVQGYINYFGSAVMAAWSAYNKLDSFVGMPIGSLGLAVTTFVGQNLGAGQLGRAKKGTTQSYFIGLAITALLIVPIELASASLVKLFSQDPDVVYYGGMFLKVMSPFYLAVVGNNIYSGTLRGAGDTKAPMLISMGCFILFRQIYLFIASKLFNTYIWIGLGYPFGWVLCSTLLTIYYYKSGWEKRRVNITGKPDTEEVT